MFNSPGDISQLQCYLHLLTIVCIENLQTRVKFADYRRNIEMVESWYISNCVTADKQYKKMYFGVPYVVAVRETQVHLLWNEPPVEILITQFLSFGF